MGNKRKKRNKLKWGTVVNDVISEALDIVYKFIMPLCNEQNQALIEHGLLSMAGIDKFSFSNQPIPFFTYDQVQSILARLNEKGSIRKSKGVYYTPPDVVKFIAANSIKASFGALTPENIRSLELAPEYVEDFCLKKTIFEPACGAGEFLLEVLEYKLKLLPLRYATNRKGIECVVRTFYGNDINIDSVVITKLRLFLCVAYRCGIEYCMGLPAILNCHFTTYDYVVSPPAKGEQYDIILGNPPYVEDHKSGLKLQERYGNIYANVLLNAALHLRIGGSMGFIIPISYSSTPRMKKLRDKLLEIVQEQFILCYADRPDCLFDSVHQKLCILICRNTNEAHKIYTGNYQYWYQEERKNLFFNTHVVLNPFVREDCIPKLGTFLDLSIYRKVMDQRNPSLYSTSRTGPHSVYVNRRETFWVKAFRREIIHPEFKAFHFATKEEADYCYCLVNSSLFWWYWISVSDCWHISKELNGFRAPIVPADLSFTDLAEALDTRLETTKEYVGTKQTEYEYRHRACLEEIHSIDIVINALFGLTQEESDYIKNFALRYRISGGAVGDERD